MLATAGGRLTRKPPQVLMTTATNAGGVVALAEAIDRYRTEAREPAQARERARNQLRRALADLAVGRATGHPGWEAAVDAVAGHDLDPLTAAEQLLP